MHFSKISVRNALQFLAALALKTTPTTAGTISVCPKNATVNPAFTTPVPFFDLPKVFPPSTAPASSVDLNRIRNTAALYPLGVDGKNFASLDRVFRHDVVANLSQGGLDHGLPALQKALEASFVGLRTQHQLGTQYIDFTDHGCQARSVTYFTATLLGTGASAGQVVYALGQYQDSWVKFQEEWRIAYRNLVFMSQPVGNASIVPH